MSQAATEQDKEKQKTESRKVTRSKGEIALTGPGGVGKTRLAQAMVQRSGPSFVDGTCSLSLASLTNPHLLIATLLQDLGIKEEPEQAPHTTLFAFLATGVIGSRLSQKAKDEAKAARQRQHEVEALLALSRDLLLIQSLVKLLNTVPNLVRDAASAEQVTLYLLEGDRVYHNGFAGFQYFSHSRHRTAQSKVGQNFS